MRAFTNLVRALGPLSRRTVRGGLKAPFLPHPPRLSAPLALVILLLGASGCSPAEEVGVDIETDAGGLTLAGEALGEGQVDLEPESASNSSPLGAAQAGTFGEVDDDLIPMSMERTVDVAELVAEVTVVDHLDQVQNTATGALEFSPEEYLARREIEALEKIVPVVLRVDTIYTPTLATPPIERVIVRMLNGIDMPEGHSSQIGVERQSGLTLDQLPIGAKALVLLTIYTPDDYAGAGFEWIGLSREMAETRSTSEDRRYESGQFRYWYTEDGGPYSFNDGSTRSYQEILDYARSMSSGG